MATEALPILKFGCETSNGTTSSNPSDQPKKSNYILLTENVISVLKKVGDCPFALYCMSGNARLGKSYTLNFFIRKLRNQEIVDSSQLFKWRKGSDRETVGINLWPEPFFMNDENGRKVGILLMDAQGLFDEHTTLQQNSVIFALSSLFSTICIFNLSKQILSDTLQNVNFFTGYARAFGHKRNTQGDLDDDSEKFQRLVILVRDFEDDDEFGYGYHDNSRAPLNSEGGRANYFHKKFPTSASNENSGSSIPYENLAVINGIRENYDNVGIILHPDPGSKFKKNPTENSPKKEFVEKSQEFVKLMLSPEFLVTKKIGGHELSGKEFIPYVEHLGVICQNAADTFPPAQTIAESASIMSHTLARTTAYNEFTEKITIFLKAGGLSDAQLNEAYQKAEKFALEAFHKIKKLGSKEKETETMNILLKKCKAKFETMKEVYSLTQRLEDEKKGRETQTKEIALLTESSAVNAAKMRELEEAAKRKQSVSEGTKIDADAIAKIVGSLALLYATKVKADVWKEQKRSNIRTEELMRSRMLNPNFDYERRGAGARPNIGLASDSDSD